MQEAHCSYYGTLLGKRHGSTIGETLLDEMYRKVLDKHESQLIKDQEVLIGELKKTFSVEIRDFKKSINSLEERLTKLEKLNKKDVDNAISKGKESQQQEGIQRKCKKGNARGKTPEASSRNCVL